jgi:Ciliary basal body-associated, B9 protein
MNNTNNTFMKNIAGAMSQTPRKMADYKSELFFIGQIVGGSDFPTDLDGLFVEASLKYGGEHWQLLSEKQSALQTHTAYCDDEGFFVWAHPFDFHFTCESV